MWCLFFCFMNLNVFVNYDNSAKIEAGESEEDYIYACALSY